MNYRHAFHAGNHADVLKHWILTQVLCSLQHKPTPYSYLDTHAGVGLYDLADVRAQRTGEWRDGIGRLWARADCPVALGRYLDRVRALNPQGDLQVYPGSPNIAAQLKRAGDELILNEKHPEDSAALRAVAQGWDAHIHEGEGWLVSRRLLPVVHKRAVLLIDPPYEQPNELQMAVQSLNEAMARMRQAVVMIWYPIKDRAALQAFYQGLADSRAPKLLCAELCVHPADTQGLGLNGSGVAVANPPWGLETDLRQTLPWLAQCLGQSQGESRVFWPKPEV